MTRGKIIIFHNDGIISSIEFNGDMYYEGHGVQVFDELKNVNTVEEYEAFVERFNNENFMYNDEELTYNPLVWCAEEDLLDMRKDYFDKWFSDYLYFKNLRDEDVIIIDDNSNKVIIAPNGIASLNFGEFNKGCVQLNVEIIGRDWKEQVEEVCKKLGWLVSLTDCEYNTFSKYSPAGEDFQFEVSAMNLKELVQEVVDYANEFDIDEHAAMWIECRGQNGTPSSIRTLIDDADDIKTMLDELAEELEKLIK